MEKFGRMCARKKTTKKLYTHSTLHAEMYTFGEDKGEKIDSLDAIITGVEGLKDRIKI